MNPLLTQSRRCEECGTMFLVPLNRDSATRLVRLAGPWECEDCRKHPVSERNPVRRHGIHLNQLDGPVGQRKRPA